MNNSNTLGSQTGHKKEQKSAKSLINLNEKEEQAVSLRFQGKSSQEIAAAVGFKATYVRKLFMSGGRLQQAYDDFAQWKTAQTKEISDLVIDRAKEEAPKAMERMVALAEDSRNGPVCYKANEKIMELSGVGLDNSLRAYFQNMSYESAKEKVDTLFRDLFGKSLQPNINITIISDK